MAETRGTDYWHERESCESLPVPSSYLHDQYRSFASDIEARVDELAPSLPYSEPFPVHESLSALSHQWESGRKALRTVPVVNLYHRVLDQPVPEDVVRVLLGIDAHINALDDIIDTQEPTKEWKTAMAAVISFSNTFAFEYIPNDVQELIFDEYYDYLVQLFQIPRLERDYVTQFRRASTDDERLEAATAFYRQRGTAMKIFTDIPAMVLDVDSSTATRMTEDLRHLKSRQLLFKDLRDVERDLRDDDATPVLHVLRISESADDVLSFLQTVYEQFPYSQTGRDQYGDILSCLEDAPSDTVASVQKGMQTVAESQYGE